MSTRDFYREAGMLYHLALYTDKSIFGIKLSATWRLSTKTFISKHFILINLTLPIMGGQLTKNKQRDLKCSNKKNHIFSRFIDLTIADLIIGLKLVY